MKTLVAVLLGATLLVGACGSDDDDVSADDTATTSAGDTATTASTSTPSDDTEPDDTEPDDTEPDDTEPDSGSEGSDGDDAEPDDAPAGEFGARLNGPEEGTGGEGTWELENVGQSPDTYTIRVEPAGSGRASPKDVTLQPGETAEIEVTYLGRGRLVVVSEGSGQEVASVPLT